MKRLSLHRRPGLLRSFSILSTLTFCIWLLLVPSNLAAEKAEPRFTSSPHAQFRFEGLVGQRVKANVDQWLLEAPRANPGMLEMFRMRDRQPTPNLVPWAGEFVGKYLISAIQALRMNERPELRALVTQTVAELVSSQADDGYLGPFPRAERLRGNWDLWGHYHVMLALLMWHEATGDTAALQACQRAADLACNTFLNGKLRVFDAGSHEMNMAIVHALGKLYRIKHEPRYLQLMREIEQDWERAGDYLRAGVAGLEFFESPRPRWESLHDLQGLMEFYRITGQEKYRTAFVHHWRSIARWDRRNTGGFSSGEQATGDPYAPTAIETCCSVAWTALSVDMLQWTGETRFADELELSLFNAILGAQHPSGRWCTYNTPMDGAREASAHTIVFQSRAGTPELNCCSVNGPRGLGLLSEWAVLTGEGALMVNYYGPGMFQGKLPDNTPVALNWVTDYPASGKVLLRVEPLASRRFRLLLRIPAWSENTSVEVNGKPVAKVLAGQYLDLNRRWEPGDRVTLQLDLGLRAVPGDRDALGRVSVYRGPLLLAWDQALNDFDEAAIPPLDLGQLRRATEIPRPAEAGALAPWLLLDLPTANGHPVRVCDFASAGAKGTRYRSWLPVSHPLPPPVVTRTPADGAAIAPGDALFRWTGPKRAGASVREYRLVIASDAEFSKPLVDGHGPWTTRLLVTKNRMAAITAGRLYWWKITAANENGSTESVGPPAHFLIDTNLPVVRLPPIPTVSPGDLLIAAALSGQPNAHPGELRSATRSTPAAGLESRTNGAMQTDGEGGMLIYRIEEFPDEDYTLTLSANFGAMPRGRLAQVCSAWASPMDDPLRLCVENGKLFARIESGQGYSTSGWPITDSRWYHLAVVKRGTDLRLYVDREQRGQATVPLAIHTQAQDIALGGNPHYSGNEFLAARFRQLRFYGRALSPQEITAADKLQEP